MYHTYTAPLTINNENILPIDGDKNIFTPCNIIPYTIITILVVVKYIKWENVYTRQAYGYTLKYSIKS